MIKKFCLNIKIKKINVFKERFKFTFKGFLNKKKTSIWSLKLEVQIDNKLHTLKTIKIIS